MSKESHHSLDEVHESINTTSQKSLWKRILSFFGPAYLISVGYMDPGNWATDIAGGSQFGYSLLWVLLMSNIMALLLQSLSARLGIVRGKDLAQASKESYPKFINYILYFLAEIAIAATDLAEVLGMAIGLQLLFDIPLLWGVCFTMLDTFLLLFLINKGIRKMEAFIIALISIIGLSFLFEMFFAKPDFTAVASGLIPSIPDSDALYIAIGIIGATVMPHNLYLHSSLVQTRKFNRDFKSIKQAIKYNLIDSTIALNLAFFVNAAILILAAATFYKNGMFQIAEIQDAHKLLAPLLGSKWAPILFALALIAAGQSSTVTGTLAGHIVMEGYLNLRIQPWVRRIITRILAIVPAVLTILILGEGATGKLLVFSQVILSLQLGFAVIPLIHFVSNKKLMGKFAIKTPIKIISWIIALVIISLNIKLVYNEVSKWLLTSQHPLWIWVVIIPLAIGAIALLFYILFYPTHKERKEKHVPHIDKVQFNKLPTAHDYTNIAIAIDFSEADKKGIDMALKLGKNNAEYTLIHIVETAGALIYGKEINDHEAATDKEYLESYQKILIAQGYKVDIKLDFGSPKKQIPKIINNGNYNLLIMGTHGHEFFKDLIFGTTIDKVRHRVKTPVLIVK
ncbi:natural resistance-associated macrophage protein metal ion transporter NRAMP [Galbibacter orientalis DSM 19592]|uniref:Divalent metal cation transporter MntH n=1 Tax=Galbibacter orientalis DSM 19592 TaxID=926559 RepID=I3C398_9FLAO|nr:Nramp family divalent metal transporter [Galbibacter orientalis]EIJ38091.1 natural resistance-associated macrophage protein metal ion transporter NRAMP [Galbibacter orientalis DSM 19592]